MPGFNTPLIKALNIYSSCVNLITATQTDS